MIGTVTQFIAEAIFASDLQPSTPTTPTQTWAAITTTIARHGTQGCIDILAHEFGEHPETAAPRMHYARHLADTLTPALALAR